MWHQSKKIALTHTHTHTIFWDLKWFHDNGIFRFCGKSATTKGSMKLYVGHVCTTSRTPPLSTQLTHNMSTALNSPITPRRKALCKLSLKYVLKPKKLATMSTLKPLILLLNWRSRHAWYSIDRSYDAPWTWSKVRLCEPRE